MICRSIGESVLSRDDVHGVDVTTMTVLTLPSWQSLGSLTGCMPVRHGSMRSSSPSDPVLRRLPPARYRCFQGPTCSSAFDAGSVKRKEVFCSALAAKAKTPHGWGAQNQWKAQRSRG